MYLLADIDYPNPYYKFYYRWIGHILKKEPIKGSF